MAAESNLRRLLFGGGAVRSVTCLRKVWLYCLVEAVRFVAMLRRGGRSWSCRDGRHATCVEAEKTCDNGECALTLLEVFALCYNPRARGRDMRRAGALCRGTARRHDDICVAARADELPYRTPRLAPRLGGNTAAGRGGGMFPYTAYADRMDAGLARAGSDARPACTDRVGTPRSRGYIQYDGLRPASRNERLVGRWRRLAYGAGPARGTIQFRRQYRYPALRTLFHVGRGRTHGGLLQLAAAVRRCGCAQRHARDIHDRTLECRKHTSDRHRAGRNSLCRVSSVRRAQRPVLGRGDLFRYGHTRRRDGSGVGAAGGIHGPEPQLGRRRGADSIRCAGSYPVGQYPAVYPPAQDGRYASRCDHIRRVGRSAAVRIHGRNIRTADSGHVHILRTPFQTTPDQIRSGVVCLSSSDRIILRAR